MPPPARAFWITGERQGELRAESLPTPGAGDLTIETLFSGVSRGTEKLVWNGLVPATEQQRMRAPFQDGLFSFPLKYGYASVGRVVDGPAEAMGQVVFALFPHQDRYVIDPAAVVQLPAGVPPERGVLAAPMETALNAVWDGQPAIGDRIAVIGGGVIGALLAYLLGRLPGASVCLFDRVPGPCPWATAFGVSYGTADDAAGPFDLIFQASGNSDGLRTALQLAGQEATVIDLSWYGNQPVSLALGEAFHSKRLTLRSSQVGHVSPHKRGTWSTQRRLALAVALLRDPALDLLIDGETRFADLPEQYPAILAAPARSLLHRVRYQN